MVNRIRAYIDKHERQMTSVAFAVGFVWDNLTLTRIDLLYDNIVLATYIIVGAIGIYLMNLVHSKVLTGRFAEWITPWLPYVIQFSFGGLFSGFFVFYSRSASLVTSWPFLVLLIALLIGNEVFKERYARFTFHMGIFYFVLFSYLIFSIPILLKTFGVWVFLVSGAVSLFVMALYTYGMHRLVRRVVERNLKKLLFVVGTIYVSINALYFLNIIPPIPLSLKDIGVYHSVERSADQSYVVTHEKRGLLSYLGILQTMRVVRGESVYVYASVFAPTKLNTAIRHEWSVYNERESGWSLVDDIQYRIYGGRDGGYRGYSYKTGLTEGLWRVRVLTERGQVIGSTRFYVEFVGERAERSTVIK